MGDSADHITEADIWLSRSNIVQARSQRLLQSWLPTAQNTASTPAEDNDGQDDFVAMTESAGLGTAPAESEFEVDGILKKRHASSNDKLLEQLLGKKAAAAKKKEQALARQTKTNIALGRAAPVPAPAKGTSATPSRPVDDDSEDEDEPGRAATFTGKRVTRDNNLPAYAAAGSSRRGATPIDEDAEPPDPRDDAATIAAMKNGTSQAHQEPPASEDGGPPRKKNKSTSYLDELLSKKKQRKKTKNKTFTGTT